MKRIYLLLISTLCYSSVYSQKIELFADFNTKAANTTISPISTIIEVHNGVAFFKRNDEGIPSMLYYTDYTTGQTDLLHDFKGYIIHYQAIGSYLVAASNYEAFLINVSNRTVKVLDPSIRSRHVSDSLLIYTISQATSYLSINQSGDTATIYKSADIWNQDFHTLLDSGKIIVSKQIQNTPFKSIAYTDGDTTKAILNAADSIIDVVEFKETNSFLYFMTRRFKGDYRVYVIEKNTLSPSIIAKEDNASLFSGRAPQLQHTQGDTLFFTYVDATNGLELWVSWGTKATTFLTENIASGFSSINYTTWTSTTNYLYFADINQSYIFSCNGRGLVDTVKVDGNYLNKLARKVTVPNSNRIFTEGYVYPNSSDYNLYVLNGTENNSYKLIDLYRIERISPANLSASGLFTFIGQEQSGDTVKIYQTLGNLGNYTEIRAVPSIGSATIVGSGPNGIVYSIADSAVYAQQGDSIAPSLVTYNIHSSQALFVSDIGNGIHAIYTSDGTVAGTKKIFEYKAATASSNYNYLTKYKDKLYFIVNDSIMVTDGTKQSLTKLFNRGHLIHTYKDSIYFFTDTAILVSDGNGYFRTFSKLSIYSAALVNAENYALMYSVVNGSQNLYKLTDTITLLKSGVNGFLGGTAKGDTILFTANDPFDNGKELFLTDGTTQNTGLWKNLRAGGASTPKTFVRVADKIYFTATDGSGTSLFSSDLTIPGTNRVPFHTSLGTSFSYQNVNDTLLIFTNSKVYFVDNNNQLVIWDNPPVLYNSQSLSPTHDFPTKGFKFVYVPSLYGMARVDIDKFGSTYGWYLSNNNKEDYTPLSVQSSRLFGSVVLGNKIFGTNQNYQYGNELFVMEICDFTAEVSIQDYVCHDDNASISVVSSPAGSYTYFLKDRANPLFEEGNSTGIFTNFEDNKNYYVAVENANGCNVVHNGARFSKPDTLQFTDVSFNAVDSGSFEVFISWSNSVPSNYTYYLNLPNGSIDTVNALDWYYHETQEGIKTVKLGVTDTKGCTISQTFVSTVSIEEFALSGVKVYPIPTSDILNIEGLDANSTIKIMDLSGRIKMSEVSLRNGTSTINLNTLAKGIYILQISTKNSTVARKIIVK